MITDTNDEIVALKNQMFILLVALIVVSGTLTTVLYRQASLAKKDIAQAQKVVAEMTNNEVVLRGIVVRLQNYGAKHADYEAILKKDGFATVGNPAAAPVAPKK
ncbi:MAG TPA: hypothetical protein VL970_04790 [Candidatus Acidoferrales bacterium]|nr:hypothetical protein [Candidatus Acidoferrales bacterium]